MSKQLPIILLFSLLVTLTACDTPNNQPKPVLISSNQVVFYNNSILKLLSTSNDSLAYQPGDYQISINKLIYQTTLQDGTSITASGIVYLPSQINAPGKQYPLLSLQHSTAFSNQEAPSGLNFSALNFSYPIYFATHGYIVVCPDYIGYGESEDFPHDYEHRQTLAQATADMLLATKAFLKKKELQWTNKVFLAGYSEGGFATLSAQQLIEDRYKDELPLAGSSCGAGPYAMPAFFNYVTQNKTVGGIANYIYAWEILSYDRIYGLNKPVSYYFKSPYAERISQSLDSARSITLSFDKICTDQFRADIKNPTSAFGKALADNDLTNWKTQTATQLIHSEEDEIIPFLTSQQTYTALRKLGSTKLSLETIARGGHTPTEVVFMHRALAWFDGLKN
ncbi:hypothetical protein GCM10028805_51110 [Spirosoma harenae]